MLLNAKNFFLVLMSVSDEILYHAKIHPEQYSNTLSDAQIKQLHSSINYVCTTSVDVLADSDQFPEDWLFKHRWSKGKKNQPAVLPNGNKIVFLTVGGRTSAVVPAVQKKIGPVAQDIADEDVREDGDANGTPAGGKRKRGTVKKEDDSEDDETTGSKQAASKKGRTRGAKSAIKEEETVPSRGESTGRRRSTRNAK